MDLVLVTPTKRASVGAVMVVPGLHFGGVEERIQSGALLKRFLVMLHLDALDDVAVVSVWTCICSQTTHA